MQIIPLCTCNQLGWIQNGPPIEREGKMPTPYKRPRQSQVTSAVTMEESEVTSSNQINKVRAIPGVSQNIDIILPHENLLAQ